MKYSDCKPSVISSSIFRHNHLRFLFHNSWTFSCINQNNVDERESLFNKHSDEEIGGQVRFLTACVAGRLWSPVAPSQGHLLGNAFFSYVPPIYHVVLFKFKDGWARLRSSLGFSGFQFWSLFTNLVTFFASVENKAWPSSCQLSVGERVAAHRFLEIGEPFRGKDNVSKKRGSCVGQEGARGGKRPGFLSLVWR